MANGVGGERTSVRALVVHSPLVGPSTVRPLARSLEASGWTVHVPDLRHAVESPERFTADAVGLCGAVDIVIGHSGAGAVLPAVAHRVAAGMTIFVDAVVPDASTVFTPSPQFIALLDTVPTTDGLLAPWHEWWPLSTIEQLLPDDAVRRRIIDEIPRVPRAFYDQRIVLPPSWWTRPAAFVQLSAAYDDDRARAERMGWPTERVTGKHLDLVVAPELVARHVRQLAEAIGSR